MPDNYDNLIQAMGLGDLLALPIEALVEADAAAARAAAELIRDYGFERDADDDPNAYGRLRTVRFTYDAPDTAGVVRQHAVQIPLLLLIPLSLLSVREAQFDFSVDVFGAMEPDTAAPAGAGHAARARSPGASSASASAAAPKRRALIAQYAAAPALRRDIAGDMTQTVSADLSVTVRVEQSDLPAGIAQLLRLTSEGVIDSEVEADGDGETDPPDGPDKPDPDDPDPDEPDPSEPASPTIALEPDAAQVSLSAGRPYREFAISLTHASGEPVSGARVQLILPQDGLLIARPPKLQTDRRGAAAFRIGADFRGLEKPVTRTLILRYEFQARDEKRRSVERRVRFRLRPAQIGDRG